jgi:hypothetical protein
MYQIHRRSWQNPQIVTDNVYSNVILLFDNSNQHSGHKKTVSAVLGEAGDGDLFRPKGVPLLSTYYKSVEEVLIFLKNQ